MAVDVVGITLIVLLVMIVLQLKWINDSLLELMRQGRVSGKH